MSRKLEPIEVRKLVRDVLFTQRRELDCDGCLQELHIYAELTITYQNPAQTMPQVAQHLEQCFCCREEFEFLLVVLRSDE
jgi:hypothetical protein